MARLAHAMKLLRHRARRDGRAEQGHDLHRERLRPHLHEQRRRHRPRLGRAPLRDGRRRQGRRHLRQRSRCSARRTRTTTTSTRARTRSATAACCRPPRSISSARRLRSGSAFRDSDALTVFPNLANFNAGSRNLGFMSLGNGQHPPELDRFGEVAVLQRRAAAQVGNRCGRRAARGGSHAPTSRAAPTRRGESGCPPRRARNAHRAASPDSSALLQPWRACAIERAASTRSAIVALGSPSAAAASASGATAGTSTCRSMRSSSGPLMRPW